MLCTWNLHKITRKLQTRKNITVTRTKWSKSCRSKKVFWYPLLFSTYQIIANIILSINYEVNIAHARPLFTLTGLGMEHNHSFRLGKASKKSKLYEICQK